MNTVPVDAATIARCDRGLAFIDLEVDARNTIQACGILAGAYAQASPKEDIAVALSHLRLILTEPRLLVGHHARQFDLPYLVRCDTAFAHSPLIDTLELAVLALPLQQTHRLDKTYKLTPLSANLPLEDARATRDLLLELLPHLLVLPLPLWNGIRWILTCGTDDADYAYQRFFSEVLGLPDVDTVLLDQIPLAATKGMDSLVLAELLAQAPTTPFDQRFFLAALLCWSFACATMRTRTAFAPWLQAQPTFIALVERLWPVSVALDLAEPVLDAFGIDALTPLQSAAIAATLAGQRPLVILPTGGGKSLCFQLPAYLLAQRQQALTVVIAPLQALMHDQVAELEAHGLRLATCLTADLPRVERQARLDALWRGEKHLLYVSPEQLRAPSILALLQVRYPALWVIDEAHCQSQWGHDFRVDYARIPDVIQQLATATGRPLPRLALFTATAPPAVQEDLRTLFATAAMPLGPTIAAPLLRRHNVRLSVQLARGDRRAQILSALHEHLVPGDAAITYTATRQRTEALATWLEQQGITCRAFHAGIADADKRAILADFKAGRLNTVVATSAFGLGIHRAGVALIIHESLCATLETYLQETGRAGRDGRPAQAIMLWDPADADLLFTLQGQNQVSQNELRDLFTALRAARDTRFTSAVSTPFWLTAEEVLPHVELRRREHVLALGLHLLDRFRLIEQCKTSRTVLTATVLLPTLVDAQQQLRSHVQNQAIPTTRFPAFVRLVTALYAVHATVAQGGSTLTLEQLGDEADVRIRDLPAYLQELTAAGLCASQVPLQVQLIKGVRGDAQARLTRLIQLEDQLRMAINTARGESLVVTLSLTVLAGALAPIAGLAIRAPLLATLLELWHQQGKIHLVLRAPHVVQIRLHESLTLVHQDLAVALVDLLYTDLGTQTGTRLTIPLALETVLADISRRITRAVPTMVTLQQTLLWLSRLGVLRIIEGMRLVQPAFQVIVKSGVRIDSIDTAYRRLVEPYQQESAWRVHAVLAFARLTDDMAREAMLDAYLHLPRVAFLERYPLLGDPACRLPVVPELYDRIMTPLNPTQRAIVVANDPALAIIAGPGAGKTRTVVHRVACLLCIRRVPPQRVLVLAYNRQAVRELRLRLHRLLGPMSMGLRVVTFHGLALALLGRSVSREGWRDTDRFDHLITEATSLLTDGETDYDDDVAVRRATLVGAVEHIFIDEYQDVTPDLYHFIRAIAGAIPHEDDTRPVQVNLCVIGDDDQNVYAFNKANAVYLQRFAEEYRARSVLLTANYRSTEPIIAAANALIQHNRERSKKTEDEQVHIDLARLGSGGAPVRVIVANHPAVLADAVTAQVRDWIAAGIPPGEIAVLARWWEPLDRIRLLLERQNIRTLSLGQRRQGKRREPQLIQHLVVWRLITALSATPPPSWEATHTVTEWFIEHCAAWGHALSEPTVQRLIRLLREMDQERSSDDLDLVRPLSAEEVLTLLFEVSASGERTHDDDQVLTSSAHSAKGLEFARVILLNEGFTHLAEDDEAERRLFYVAMTRAKDELVIVAPDVRELDFVEEAGLHPTQVLLAQPQARVPHWFYSDLTLADVVLSYAATLQTQDRIQQLREGDILDIIGEKGRFLLATAEGTIIGALSSLAMETLSRRRIAPNVFTFAEGEVHVRHVVQWKDHEHDQQRWIVLPSIRVYREDAFASNDDVNALLHMT